MARQFDVFAPPDGPMVVIIQSDILDPMPTRVAVPLLDPKRHKIEFRSLTPMLDVGGRSYILAPQLTATFTLTELGSFVTEVPHQRDRIVRAFDALLGGI